MINRPKFILKAKDSLCTPESKRKYNEQHFSEAANRYNFATQAMSLGRDTHWKKTLIKSLPQISAPMCVDLACGTGDITFMLAKKYTNGKIIGIDLTQPMLDIAKQHNQESNVNFLKKDMLETHLPDNSVDIITGGYAIRNAPDLQLAFQEISRILKPDGVVALLDFSKSPLLWAQKIQTLVLKYWCGLWGFLLHGNPEIHSYIAASLKTFPDRNQIRTILHQRDFNLVSSRRFFGGTLELLIMRKINSKKV